MKKVFDISYWILLLACSILLCSLMIFRTEIFTTSTLFNIVIILPCICLMPYYVKELILITKKESQATDKGKRVTIIESVKKSFPMYPLMLLGVTLAKQFYNSGTVFYECIILSSSFITIILLYIIKNR